MGLSLVHIIAHCGVIAIDWRMYTLNCNCQTSGDEESNARNAQAFVVLEGKPCWVSHLQSKLQVYWNSYFNYAPLNFLIVWVFCPWVACLMYFWMLSPYQIYDLEISSAKCKLPFDFADVSLFGIWCGPTGLFLQLLHLLLVWKQIAKIPKKKLQRLMARRLPQCLLLRV